MGKLDPETENPCFRRCLNGSALVSATRTAGLSGVVARRLANSLGDGRAAAGSAASPAGGTGEVDRGIEGAIYERILRERFADPAIPRQRGTWTAERVAL